jgi:hypothetical protein
MTLIDLKEKVAICSDFTPAERDFILDAINTMQAEEHEMTIVKVQVPLFTSDTHKKALVYDERRAQQTLQVLDKKENALMGGDIKAFFEADWDGERWRLVRRVRFQSW